MKKIFLTMVLMSVMSVHAFADEPPVATIKVSPEWGKTQCASQPGKGVSLVLRGVEDKRSTKAIGTLKKGDDEVEVLLSTSVDELVNSAIATVFKNCGFDVKTKSDGSAGIATTVEIDKFFAGSKKGFFTGETDATGTFVLHFSNAGRSYDFNLSASKSDKRLRKKNVKQLEDVMTGVLEMTVNQISESPELFTELKSLSK